MSLSDGLMSMLSSSLPSLTSAPVLQPETTAAPASAATGCALEGVASVVVLGDCHGDGERLQLGPNGAAGGWGDRELLGALIRDGYSLDAHDRRLAELGWSALGADALEKARWLNARPDNRGNDHATWVVAYA